MTWGMVAGAAIGTVGSIYGANKAAGVAEESRDLPDWLKPYITGKGDIPSYIERDPLINTNWMDYVKRLGQGDTGAQWNPMTANSPWFQPDKTFTPNEGGGPYGQLPPGMDPYGAPPQQPQQQGGGLDIDALTSFLKNKNTAMFMGGEGAQYGNTGDIYGYMKRGGSDMSYSQMDELNELAKLLGR